jgi:hypothetical protein
MLKNSNNFNHYPMSPEFWVDMDIETAIRLKFAQKLKSTSKHTVADGHWTQYYLNKNEIDGKSIENINLFRQCQSRRHSMLYYGVYDSSNAHNAKSQNQLNLWQQKRLNATLNVEECLNNYTCLKQSNFVEVIDPSYPDELRHVCGTICTNLFSGYRDMGAIHNIHDPSVFTVVGTLENLEQFFDMLECAYPQLFHNIAEIGRMVSNTVDSDHHNIVGFTCVLCS